MKQFKYDFLDLSFNIFIQSQVTEFGNKIQFEILPPGARMGLQTDKMPIGNLSPLVIEFETRCDGKC